MKLRNKISILVTATTSLAAIGVAGGVLFINFTAGMDSVNSKLNSLISSVSASTDDTLTYALLAVESQEMTLAYEQFNGQVSILQDSGGPLKSAHTLTKEIDLGYGEKLIFSVSQEPIYQNLYRSLWLSALLVLVTIALSQLIAWLVLWRDISIIKKLIVNAKDISAGKNVEIAKDNGSTDLNDLAQSLQVMVSRLQDSKNEMQSFLWDVSHELKTPLTVMRGYLEILTKQDQLSSEQQAKALDRTQSSVLRMQTLVEDLLLLAELGERGQGKVQPVMLSDLLDKWAQDFKALQPQRKIDFINNQVHPLNCTPELLEQFFTNAFSNIKAHTLETDRVKVTVNQTAAGVQIDIEDAGQGMAKLEDGKSISEFERFDKGHAQKPGSSGLGLSIMSKIVDIHGGQMQLTQSSLGGVCVSAFFPNHLS